MRRLLLTCLFAVAGLAPLQAQDKPTFVFTAIPDQDPTRLMQRFSAVADYLHEKLGVPVKYVPVKDYPAAVTSFVNDEVQMAWFGGFTGVQARAKLPGAQAIAQGVEDKQFKTYFIANTQADIKEGGKLPDTVMGKTFSYGSRSSTSGRVMPQYFIEQRFGKPPEQVFAKVGFSGDHTKTIQLVQSGAYQLGAVDYSVWNLEKKAGHVDESKVKVIWVSPPFPDYQWTVRGELDQKYGAGFTKKLQDALIAATDPKILGPFGRSKFVPADNAEYKPVEEVARERRPAQLTSAAPALVALDKADIGYAGRIVLASVDLTIREGERIALLGRSGVGKSTLLNTLHAELADRATLIPQAAALVPQLSAFHNVYMGRLDRHSSWRNLRELVWPAKATLAEVEAVLARVGLSDALRQKAGSLSGGQAQRVSVARALYNGRAIVLGDEPVSALDRGQGSRVLETIHATHATSVLALHDVALALAHATRIVALKDGRIALDAPCADLTERDLAPFYEAPR